MSELDLPTMSWRKSSRSSGQGGNCVELGGLSGAVAVRDSKDPDGPNLAYTAAEWATFVTAIKSKDHDLP
jgi:hypothetical protein